MATDTATVDSSASDHHVNHLHSESIPSIDLHLLSQSELFSLSLCSSSSVYHHQNDADVSTLKIDRSVFNESAGGRKQTFSRLRLAPRNNSQFSSSSSIKSPIPYQTAELSLDEESSQIVSVLKSLFRADSNEVNDNDDNLVSVPIQFNSFLDSHEVLHDVSIGTSDYNGEAEMKHMAIADSTTRKRKRGRPRRNERILSSIYTNYTLNQVTGRISADDNVKVEKEKVELVMTNVNGTTESEALAIVEDPYVEELKRRTMGMHTREQLLEFLQGFNGEWLSKRKKRKIVDASVLGHVLPQGWKLMLSIKKRAGYFWITCKRCISPNGQQFISYKEASSYLNTPDGLQGAIQLKFGHVDDHVQLTEKISSGNVADLTPKVDKNEGALNSCPGLLLSESAEHEKQTSSLKVGISGQIQMVGKYNCHKCTSVFGEPDDLLQHLLAYHQRAQRRLGQGTYLNEEVLIKNGKYECQLCHKLFEERHRYNGHFGNHIKDYFKRIEASGEAMTILRRGVHPSVAVHPNNVRIQESTEIDMGSGTKSNDELSDAVPNCKIKENTTVDSSCGSQGIICSMTDDKAGNTNDIIAVETSVCMRAESVLANNGNVSIRNSPCETNVSKCTGEGINNFGIQEEGSQNCSLTVGREQTSAIDNIENQVGIRLNEGHDQELGLDNASFAINSVEKVYDGKNIKDKVLSSSINGSKIYGKDLVGKDKVRDDCSTQEYLSANAKDQINSQGILPISSGSDQRYSSMDNVHELSTLNQISAGTVKESRSDEIGNSGNSELTSGFGSKKVEVEDTVTGNERESSLESCLVIQTWNEKAYCTENDVVGNSRCTRKKHWLEKNCEGRQLAVFGCEQYLDSENTTPKVSVDIAMVSNLDESLCFKNSMHSKDVHLSAGHATTIDLESSSSNPLVFSSGNELTFALKDDGVLNGASNNLVHDKISVSRSHKPFCDRQIFNNENNLNMTSLVPVDQPKSKEVKSSYDGEAHISRNCSHINWDAYGVKSTMQESCSKDSSLILGSEQKVATEDNVTGLFSSHLDEHKQAPVERFLCLSNSEQDSVGNNSNKVLTSEIQEEPSSEDFNPRKNQLMTAFSSNSQASENAIPEFMWKTDEENNLCTSFADTSYRLARSSGCFSTSDLLSDKGGNELFGEKLSGMSGSEVLRSVNMENTEYNFMSNHSDESKILPYDAEIAEGLGSSVWLEKEALPLLPKIASRRQIPALCVWCRNEFHYEAFESEAQSSSLSFTCGTCKAKFSGQFSLL